MNFEAVLRRRLFERLERFQRTSSNLLSRLRQMSVLLSLLRHGRVGAPRYESIAGTEHAAAIRTHIARLKIATTAMDGVDLVPPQGGQARQVLSVKASGWLIAKRTVGEVLYLAFGGKAGVRQGGFFPTGLNGTIALSSEVAAPGKIAA